MDSAFEAQMDAVVSRRSQKTDVVVLDSIDLIKVRLQTVGKHWDGKPPNMGGMFKHILKAEGKHHQLLRITPGCVLLAHWLDCDFIHVEAFDSWLFAQVRRGCIKGYACEYYDPPSCSTDLMDG
jgi:hypothetical protein